MSTIDDIIRGALAEDAPWGDVTSETFLPETAQATAALVAREPGVLSGIEVFARVFELADTRWLRDREAIVSKPAARGAHFETIPAAPESLNERVEVELLAADGQRFEPGQVLARATGPARTVLRAERVALNLIQRMSGIATLTAQYVAAVAGTGARITDTRKTTPGLRIVERQAVRDGGGRNHRFSLSDAVLAKDNHLGVLAAAGVPVGEAIRAARATLGHTVHLEVEVDRLEQVEEVVAAGVDTIMLDNFSLEQLRAGVALVAGRALVEASGGVNLDTVAGIAATGVDVISVGALTHSARALDLGLDLEIA